MIHLGRKVLFLVICIGLFFGINFSFLGVSTLYISTVLIAGLGALQCLKSGVMNVSALLLQVPLALALSISLASFIVNYPDADSFMMLALGAMLVINVFSFSFFELFFNSERSRLLYYIALCFVINALLIIVMFVAPSIQLIYLSYLNEDIYMRFGGVDVALDSMYRLRMVGFSGFASYATGFAQVIGLFVLTIYYRITFKGMDWQFVLFAALLTISVAISSRAAIPGVLLWIIFSAVFFGVRFFVISMVVAAIMASVFVVSSLLLDDASLQFFTAWILDFFVNGIESASLRETIAMFSVDISDVGLLGHSRWYGDLGFDYFRHVDIGFIRILLASGYLGLTFITLHYVCVVMGAVVAEDRRFILLASIFIMTFALMFLAKGAIIFDFLAFNFVLMALLWVSWPVAVKESAIEPYCGS